MDRIDIENERKTYTGACSKKNLNHVRGCATHPWHSMLSASAHPGHIREVAKRADNHPSANSLPDNTRMFMMSTQNYASILPKRTLHYRHRKTDNKDAKMLADYAQAIEIKGKTVQMLYCPRSAEEETLEALVKRRSQLVEMRTAEKNRLTQIHETQKQSVEDLIAHFDALIDALDEQIFQYTDSGFDGKGKIISSIKGVGNTTCAMLIAMLPELGQLSHKKIALLVGVVPPPDQSGDSDGKTGCIGGRKEVRDMLYMAALSASRFEPAIKVFYERLIAKGKPFKVAINACMHKLLRILNARVRDYLQSERLAHA
jgi:transposase